MKYKVNDRVRIKSIDWYNENKDEDGDIPLIEKTYSRYNFIEIMRGLCGKVMTISNVSRCYYDMVEDNGEYFWTDEMIEGLVEEETKNWTDVSIPDGPYTVTYDSPSMNDSMNKNNINNEIILPKGYIFKDENGNVINATKIVLEKREYPKTYDECCDVLSISSYYKLRFYTYEHGYNEYATSNELCSLQDKLNILGKLIICRNAYWKLYGDEMGLGKPWEPDYTEESWEQGCPIKYVIYYTGTNITKERKCTPSCILAFPTEEMRDAFYENFKELIEQCKELL